MFSPFISVSPLILALNEGKTEFLKFFSIFLEFSITRQVETEQDESSYFLPFWAVINVFLLQMKLKWNSSNFLNFFANLFGIFYYALGRNEMKR